MKVRNAISYEDGQITTNDIYKAIFKTIKYGLTDDFEEVLFNIISRIDDYSSEEDIYQSIDDKLIYDADQWTVMKHYQRPSEANFDGAMEELTSDILVICDKLVKHASDVKESISAKTKNSIHRRK